MTTPEFWNQLDALAQSKDKSNALLEAADLLREAYKNDLPLLIACRRTPGSIHHLYTIFDERNPGVQGNRYLICFTSEKQAHKRPPEHVVIDDTHEQGPVFSEDDTNDLPAGKKRRKRKTKAVIWNTNETGEIAKVSVRKVLAYMKRSNAIGGLVFNPYDDKRSLAIAKFLV